MRLIDADKLYPDCLTTNETLAISQSQIANAPTIKSFTLEDIEGVRSETIKMMENRYARPQGEWIPSFQNIGYTCSICGRVVVRGAWEDVTEEFPYCHCGANMQKGGAE